MKAPLKIINEYIKIEDIEVNKLSNMLTKTGTMVESIEDLSKENDDLIIGKIMEIKDHPNADKLKICYVDIGKQVLQIVTGAKNIKEGIFVCVARDGDNLYGNFQIKTSDLRGIKSEGMLCSYEELGFSKDIVIKELQDGIIEIDHAEISKSFFSLFGIDFPVLEFELTFNRPDCMSIMGLVNEFKASTDKEIIKSFRKIDLKAKNLNNKIKTKSNTDACSSFISFLLKDIKVKPSSTKNQIMLMQLGIRPINNIVDATNYAAVMSGNPCHAYDYKFVKDELTAKLITEKEEFIALDDNKYILEKDDIVIESDGKVLSIAGIMGGEESSVNVNTKDIVLEFASFDKSYIRRTASRLGIRSNSSIRFEKGVNDERIEYSIALFLDYLGIDNAEYNGFINYNPERIINIRKSRIKRILDIDISLNDIKCLFNKLNINSEIDTQNNSLNVKIPSFRDDLKLEIDLIEEIARLYGYDNIGSNFLSNNLNLNDNCNYDNKINIKESLWALGFNEMVNYSFISKVKNLKLLESAENLIEIENPLGEDFSIMRPNLVITAIEVIEKNFKKGNSKISLFELGSVFSKDEIYKEEKKLILATNIGDFYDLKSVLLMLLESLNIKEKLEYKISENKLLHKGRSADIYINGIYLGFIGELSPVIAQDLENDSRIYLSELNYELLINNIDKNIIFDKFSKYPSSRRDISLLVDKDITHKDLINKINEAETKYLIDVEIFDVYTGKGIDKDKKSMSYSMEFNSKDKTLTEMEVDEDYLKVLTKVQELGAKRR